MNAVKTLPVSKTEGQLKKHISQMKGAEIAYLARAVYGVKRNLRLSSHLKNRIDLDDVRISDIRKIIESGVAGKIIEYNETPNKFGIIERRVLVRGTETEYRKFHKGKEVEAEGYVNLCFVVNIDTGIVVTAYYNLANDHHRIDWSRYTSSLQIIKED